MGIEVKIKDGIGNANELEVNKYHAAATYDTIPEVLPEGTKNRRQFFRSVLTSMNVDGSVTPIEFTVSAADTYDIYIRQISLIIEDSKVYYDKYGNIAPLTNGVDLIVSESGTETFILESAKTGSDISSQLGIENPAVRVSSVSGELITLTFDVTKAIEGGIRLGKNGTDFLKFVVNDSLLGLDAHNLYIIGYKHID